MKQKGEEREERDLTMVDSMAEYFHVKIKALQISGHRSGHRSERRSLPPYSVCDIFAFVCHLKVLILFANIMFNRWGHVYDGLHWRN